MKEFGQTCYERFVYFNFDAVYRRASAGARAAFLQAGVSERWSYYQSAVVSDAKNEGIVVGKSKQPPDAVRPAVVVIPERYRSLYSTHCSGAHAFFSQFSISISPDNVEDTALIQPLSVFPNVLLVVGNKLPLNIQRAARRKVSTKK